MDPEPKPDPQGPGEQTGRRRHRVRVSGADRPRRSWRWLGRVVALFAAAVAGGAAVWAVMQLARPVAHPPPDPRLIGTWVSDADRTIAELRKTRDISDADELDMRRRLFKTVMTFTPDELTTDVNGTQTYRVVRRTDEGVVLKYWIEASMEDEEVRFTFVAPDRVRLDLPKFSLTEFYRRVH